jgi:hypothetical protein
MKKVGIIALTFAVFLLAGCGTNYSKLEKDLADKATKYYNDDIKGKVLFVDQQQVSLSDLEKAKVDITEFTKESCDKSSYVLLKFTLDDKGLPKGDYKIETHLICGDYETGK